MGVIGFVVMLFPEPARVEVYRNGLRFVRRRPVEIRFDDLIGFSEDVVQHYVNGEYKHTSVSMAFQRANGERVEFEGAYTTDGKRFDDLRDLVAEEIASVRQRALASHGRIPWVAGVTITPEELLVSGAFKAGKAAKKAVRISKDLRVRRLIAKGGAR
jgi:hypothetical protein